jgi:hypothetical protein
VTAIGENTSMSEVTVEVFGKYNCDVCERFKSRVEKMGFDYKFDYVDKYTVHHDGWREDGSIGILAALELNNGIVPIARIDNEYYNYAKAIKKLKEIKGE